jgi:hypothetical protein
MEVTPQQRSSGDVQHFADRFFAERGVRLGRLAQAEKCLACCLTRRVDRLQRPRVNSGALEASARILGREPEDQLRTRAKGGVDKQSSGSCHRKAACLAASTSSACVIPTRTGPSNSTTSALIRTESWGSRCCPSARSVALTLRTNSSHTFLPRRFGTGSAAAVRHPASFSPDLLPEQSLLNSGSSACRACRAHDMVALSRSEIGVFGMLAGSPAGW